MIEVTKQVVHASDAGFEEHPESYRPRVFVGVMPPHGGAKVYEILSNGQAIPWPSLPQKETCGLLLDDLCRQHQGHYHDGIPSPKATLAPQTYGDVCLT